MSLLCCSGQGIPKSFSNSCTSFFISPNWLLGTPNIGIKCSQFRSSLTVCWEIELLIDHHFLHTDSHLSAWWPEMQIIYRNHLDQCLEIGLSVDATITRKYLLNNLIIVNWWWARAIPRRQLINKWVVSPPLLSSLSTCPARDNVSPGPGQRWLDVWRCRHGPCRKHIIIFCGESIMIYLTIASKSWYVVMKSNNDL